jgi:hypothetical protein
MGSGRITGSSVLRWIDAGRDVRCVESAWIWVCALRIPGSRGLSVRFNVTSLLQLVLPINHNNLIRRNPTCDLA